MHALRDPVNTINDLARSRIDRDVRGLDYRWPAFGFLLKSDGFCGIRPGMQRGRHVQGDRREQRGG
jgi:hypothetical protein